MARKPRIHYPGACYHVILRGNAKQTIFHGSDEIKKFQEILAQGIAEHNHRLLAYCWMKNHIHMALQTPADPLSKMMQSLSQRYTRWFNHRHNRVGHLFQGRYKAILVDSNAYLHELIRYIHLNPVRANLVMNPSHYKDSSHDAYSAPGKAPAWLSIDLALELFGDSAEKARANYLEFMGQPIDPDLETLLKKSSLKGKILGDENFVHQALDKSYQSPKPKMTIEEISRLVANEQEIDESELATSSRSRKLVKARAMIALLAVDQTVHTLSETAAYLGRELPTMSKQVKNMRTTIKKDQVLNNRIKRLAKTIVDQSKVAQSKVDQTKTDQSQLGQKEVTGFIKPTQA